MGEHLCTKEGALDLGAAKLAGDIIRDYRSEGVTLALADATIAAVVIQNGLVLATYNENHYPMARLTLISRRKADR